MFDRRAVMDFYQGDTNIRRLQDLEFRIRGLHKSGDYKKSIRLIKEGERALADGSSLPDSERNGLEETVSKLNGNLEGAIKARAVKPAIEQRFYAEWNPENKKLYLVLPFPTEGAFEDFTMVGLARWYAGANKQLSINLYERGFGDFVVFEINNIPNLSVADRTLNNLITPNEFELLNIRLHPALTLIYPSQYQNGDTAGIVLPEDIHPSLRSRYSTILEFVDSHFDEFGVGVHPRTARTKLLEQGINIPESKLGKYMKTLVEMGYLKRTGTPATSNVMYFPLRAVVNSSS